ncbi:hypothetical protein [Frankia sp. EAN1pec]
MGVGPPARGPCPFCGRESVLRASRPCMIYLCRDCARRTLDEAKGYAAD